MKAQWSGLVVLGVIFDIFVVVAIITIIIIFLFVVVVVVVVVFVDTKAGRTR
jgi:hypothetical protein